MLRTTIPFLLVLAAISQIWAEKPSNWATEMLDNLVAPKSGQVETLGIGKKGHTSPAVHVNSNGIEYGSGEASSTVNRLRSARDSIVLPPTKTTSEAAKPLNTPKRRSATDALAGTSSRRARPAKVKTPSVNSADVRSSGDAVAASDVPSMTPAKPVAPNADANAPRVASKPTTPTAAAASKKARAATESTPPSLQPVSEPSLDAIGGSVADNQPLTAPIQLSPQIPFTSINIDPVPSGTPASSINGSTVGIAPKTAPSATRNSATRDPFAGMRTRDPSPKVAKSLTSQKNSSTTDAVLLSNRSPALVVKTHGKKTIRVGRVATYYVTAANSGDLAAEDVIVSVKVPNWAELTRNQATSGLVRIEPNGSGDNTMRWSIRNLQPKDEQRLRIDIIPRSSRPIELGVNWNFKSVSATAHIEVQEPKLQMSVLSD